MSEFHVSTYPRIHVSTYPRYPLCECRSVKDEEAAQCCAALMRNPVLPAAVGVQLIERDDSDPLPSEGKLTVALRWDFKRDAIDLDCSAVAFSHTASIKDAVFYNNLSALNGALKHSGDNRDGKKAGDDELIEVDLTGLTISEVAAVAFVVNCHTAPGSFADVQTACVQVRNSSQEIMQLLPLSLEAAHSSTACTVCMIHTKATSPGWFLKAVGRFSEGRTFEDVKNVLRDEVAKAIGLDCGGRGSADDKGFFMTKGERYALSGGRVNDDSIQVGLGWTACLCTDLDVSAIAMDANDKVVTTVYHGHTSSAGISHGGDNVTGIGSGDDEVITIRFSKLEAGVDRIYFTVSVWTVCCLPWPVSSFLGAPIAFARLFNEQTEYARFPLGCGSIPPTNNLAIAALKRTTAGWEFVALGKPICLPLPCMSEGTCLGSCLPHV